MLLYPRYPDAHILFMVIVEMVKEITGLDALIIQVDKVLHTFPLMHCLNFDILR